MIYYYNNVIILLKITIYICLKLVKLLKFFEKSFKTVLLLH